MRLFLLFLFGLTLLSAPVTDFDVRVLKFQRHWDRFLRAYWGCKPESVNRKDCNPTQVRLDLKQFNQAREAAKTLFDLP